MTMPTLEFNDEQLKTLREAVDRLIYGYEGSINPEIARFRNYSDAHKAFEKEVGREIDKLRGVQRVILGEKPRVRRPMGKVL